MAITPIANGATGLVARNTINSIITFVEGSLLPYTGATSNVDLGSKNITTTGVGTFGAANTTNTIASLIVKSSTATNMFGVFNDGHMALGPTNPVAATFRISVDHTGGVAGHGVYLQGNILSDVTTSFNAFRAGTGTTAAAFTLTTYIGFLSSAPAVGAASAITNAFGFSTGDLNIAGITNGYSYVGNTSAGATKYNLYMQGTAQNYIAGSVGIGVAVPLTKLHIVDGTSVFKVGEVSSGVSAIWLTATAADSTNYAISGSGTSVDLNAASTLRLRVANDSKIAFISDTAFLKDGLILDIGTGTGTKIGAATTNKISFWNKTPIVQPTTGITGATLVSNGGTTLTSTDTFGGYTVQQLAAVIINTGLAA
jgi:hypothetical protein